MTDRGDIDQGPTGHEAMAPAAPQEVASVVVKFRIAGQTAQLQTNGLDLAVKDVVVIESDKGPCLATVVMPAATGQASLPLRKVLRLATDDDLRTSERNRQREAEAMQFCRQQIQSHALPMKLVGVEFTQSGNRATFFFTSAERVDFRSLVKDLARRFHTRIEMRQIGVRDAARHTGGVGICGRELCCASWLPEFKPISIRMAKDQNLALNHEKLSGVCGRLRCCLKYEQDLYQKYRKGLPKLGKRVITPDGEGRVKDINVLKQRVRVQLGPGDYREYGGEQLSRPDNPRPTTPPHKAVASVEPKEASASPSSAATQPDAEAESSEQTKKKRKRRRRRRRKKPADPPSDS